MHKKNKNVLILASFLIGIVSSPVLQGMKEDEPSLLGQNLMQYERWNAFIEQGHKHSCGPACSSDWLDGCEVSVIDANSEYEPSEGGMSEENISPSGPRKINTEQSSEIKALMEVVYDISGVVFGLSSQYDHDDYKGSPICLVKSQLGWRVKDRLGLWPKNLSGHELLQPLFEQIDKIENNQKNNLKNHVDGMLLCPGACGDQSTMILRSKFKNRLLCENNGSLIDLSYKDAGIPSDYFDVPGESEDCYTRVRQSVKPDFLKKNMALLSSLFHTIKLCVGLPPNKRILYEENGSLIVSDHTTVGLCKDAFVIPGESEAYCTQVRQSVNPDFLEKSPALLSSLFHTIKLCVGLPRACIGALIGPGMLTDNGGPRRTMGLESCRHSIKNN